MSKELTVVDPYAAASLDEKRAYVAAIAQAGDLLPQSLWTKPMPDGQGGMTRPAPSPAKVLLLAETGAMLGLHPMAALQGIHIIEGKPTLSANLLSALVRRAGHRLRVSTSGDWESGTFVARAALMRSDDPDFEFVVEWGAERAKRAGLLGKRGPWQSYPEAMCKSRAITEVIREGAPDVTLVAAYTPEELGANVSEDGEPVDVQQMPQSTPQPRQQPQQHEDVTEATIEPEASAQQQPEQPQRQADIVDAEVVTSEDWVERVSAAGDAETVLSIYREARLKGELKATVEIDGEQHELGAWMVEIGKSLREAEIAATDEGAPAVLAERDEHTTGGHY